MPTTTLNDVLIDGNQDVKQLRVQANPTGQTQPLQTWENGDGTVVLAQISKDGNAQLGDDLLGWSTPDALIEAHRAETSTTKPKRGFHSLGRITNLLSDVINWATTELELLGTAGVSGLQTAFRAKLTHNNSGSSTGAELRAGDFQSINQTGSSSARVGQATGVRGTASNTPSGSSAYLTKAVGVEGAITNAAGGNITDAAAFEVAAPSNNGTIATLYGLRVPNLTQGGTNYAIHTGQGAVHLGDFLELAHVSAPPAAPANTLRLYAKADNKLYTKNAAGVETELGAGGGGVFSGARVYRTTDQTISSGTATDVSFDAERFDTANYHDSGTPTHLTVPSAGKYLLIANIQWQTYSSGIRRLSIRLNGTTYIASVQYSAASSGPTRQSVSTIWEANAGDYFTCEVYHNAPTGDTQAAGSYAPEFMIVKLS